MHRAEWDLHYQRPSAIQYAYSIATVAGAQTPIVPEGAYAPPGDYQLTLSVDGKTERATLKVLQDPRTSVSDADFRSVLTLSQEIGASLATARRGYGEMTAAQGQLTTAAAALKTARPAEDLAARVAALADRLKPPKTGPGFLAATAVLAGIETDLEAADRAPTEPQRATAARARAQIDALWTAWTALRDGDLAQVNTALAAAGQKPVVIPSGDSLVVKPPAGGEELP